MKKKVKAVEPSKWMKCWKLTKTIAIFLGLKVLELWCFISIWTILGYVILCLQDWSFSVLGMIGSILFYAFMAVAGAGFALIVIFGVIGVIGWLKDNWNWAKEIVSGDTPRKF